MPPMAKCLAATVLLLSVTSPSMPSAHEEFAHLGQEAHAAHVAGDKASYLATTLKMQRLLNDAPDAIEAVAQAYVAAGDNERALMALDDFAGLGQVDENLLTGKDKIFSALHDLPQYRSILELFAANMKAVARSEIAFTLSDSGILAEDIDYDPQSRSFLITSVLKRKIIRVEADGKSTDFALSPSGWPLLALKVDPKRKLVWATEVAMDGYSTAPKKDWGRSAVLCFDLQTGALLHRIEGPNRSALGDMVLTQGGDPIVSDGDGGGVYKVISGRLALINGKDFISPQTPAMLPDGKHVLVPDYARGIGLLDLNNRHVTWVNRGESKKIALNGVDGLYYDRGTLILTQNGTSPERVILVQVDKTFAHTMSEQIIERATPNLGDPTHGVVVGDSFYYIANSGWNQLDPHGDVLAGAKLTPARIMRFRLNPSRNGANGSQS
jgi:sugar lactone lactonase YvrE